MSAALVRKMFKQQWPRLYLDTAVFISMGRGLMKPALMNELVSAIERHSILVLVSVTARPC